MKAFVKSLILILCALMYMGCAADVQMTTRPQETPYPPPTIRHQDLKVLQLTMSPDPVREGQRVSFQAIVTNFSQYSARADLLIQDKDEIITQVGDVLLRPGDNRIIFPQTHYRFTRNEYCFTVVVELERRRRPIEIAREFCTWRTYQGWTMGAFRVGPLLVEDLDFSPDPVIAGREFQFRIQLRNDGNPLRADLQIMDGEQVVAKLNDVYLSRGVSNLLFPPTRYSFQRFEHCFTVVVDVERIPYRMDAKRPFCAKIKGWTLNPVPHRP